MKLCLQNKTECYECMPMKQNNTHMISPKLNVDDVSYGLLVAMFYLVKNNLILLAFSDTRFQKSRRARVRTTQTGRSIAVALGNIRTLP